jgi:hypothetical protein
MRRVRSYIYSNGVKYAWNVSVDEMRDRSIWDRQKCNVKYY